ncbi:E3 ubiquitin-protein ligase siah-1 [Plutella xylostella]|uniref:E3 ubiquitin-protein ligase siah-1 n=1 Tax=Plutella xylostella TaxID=51655 RepID=UPI002032CD45|nr:E3 ubiquitin-protein ligase siah-1 [Plutella xylostella]
MANTTELKSDTLPDLDDLLQCPVCYEIPAGQIFQCNEGHHVCGRCKVRLDQCPVCRALFFGTRNYAMEELIANVRKLQAFKLGGKMTVTSVGNGSGSGGSESTTSADNSVAGAPLDGSVEDGDIEDNRIASRAPAACKGLFRCLCCKDGCAERLPAARLLNHLRYFHSPDLLEGKSDNGEYVQAWQIATVPGRIVIAVRVSDMGVFFLVIEISKQSLYAWVSMAAAPLVAHDFCYTITISGNDREAIFTDCVWSVRSCEGALKKRGRCLVVTGGDVRALTAAANVSGRLALRRAPADQQPAAAQPRAVLRVASRGSAAPARASIEPFLQDLQDDVARLSRAFATLGREASALARSESQLRANVAAVRARETRLPAPVVEEPPAPLMIAAADEINPVLSRNARRRMRLRMRAALDAAQSPVGRAQPAEAPPAPAPAPVPAPRAVPPPAPAPHVNEGPSSGAPQAPSQQRTNKKKRRQRR